jgi:GT2 family glycosyltransferase
MLEDNGSTNAIEVSICIVSWNTCEILRECLKSIYDSAADLSIEVIVVDNASSDSTTTMIKNEYPQVALIENSANRGFAKANNQAIERCRGRYIAILNPDILVKNSFLHELISFTQEHPEAGAVGCRLVNRDGSIEKSYHDNFPTLFSEFTWGFLLHRIFRKHGNVDCSEEEVMEVSWIIGACMFFRADVLKRFGGFSEKYNIYTEDVDLCYRLKSRDLKVYYVKNLEIIHYHGASSAKQKKHYFSTVMQRESRYTFMLEYYGAVYALLYRILWISSGIMRVIILSLLYSVSCVGSSHTRNHYGKKLEKYARVVFWGVGFERWCRNPFR